MPRPTKDAPTVRADLGMIGMEYHMEAAQRGLIGAALMPFFPVAVQSGHYPYVPLSQLLKTGDLRRAPKAGYKRGEWQWDEKTFATLRYGWEEPIDDQERAMYEGLYRGLNIDEITTQIAIDVLLRGFEKRVAAKIQSTSNFTNAAATVAWDVAATSDPRADVKTGIETIEAATGMTPNTLAITKKMFRRVEESESYLDHVKYVSAILTESWQARLERMAAYLDVDRILVSNAVENTSKDPDTASLENIWSNDYAFLGRITDQPHNLKDPCVGRTFLWTEGTADVLPVEEYYEPQNESTIIRVKHDTDECLVFKACGYLITGIETDS